MTDQTQATVLEEKTITKRSEEIMGIISDYEGKLPPEILSNSAEYVSSQIDSIIGSIEPENDTSIRVAREALDNCYKQTKAHMGYIFGASGISE